MMCQIFIAATIMTACMILHVVVSRGHLFVIRILSCDVTAFDTVKLPASSPLHVLEMKQGPPSDKKRNVGVYAASSSGVDLI